MRVHSYGDALTSLFLCCPVLLAMSMRLWAGRPSGQRRSLGPSTNPPPLSCSALQSVVWSSRLQVARLARAERRSRMVCEWRWLIAMGEGRTMNGAVGATRTSLRDSAGRGRCSAVQWQCSGSGSDSSIMGSPATPMLAVCTYAWSHSTTTYALQQTRRAADTDSPPRPRCIGRHADQCWRYASTVSGCCRCRCHC